MDPAKLAGAMWRAMSQTGVEFRHARCLADAVGIYLRRTSRHRVTSDELFAMVMKVFRKVQMDQAAEAFAVHRICRAALRQCLIVMHDTDSATLWDKSWLADHVEYSWGLSRSAARIVAGHVEADLLSGRRTTVSRRDVLGQMNECVAALGLASAVPLTPTASRA